MKLKRTDLVSRIANFSSFVVFLLLIVFLIWAATLIQQATSEVKTSTFVSDTYLPKRKRFSMNTLFTRVQSYAMNI
jgi:hypothetical protein